MIWGGVHVDIEGTVRGISHETGITVVCKFLNRVSDKEQSKCSAKIYDKDGNLKAELNGSW